MIRAGDFETLNASGRLFQEWLVDMAVRSEEQKLKFIRFNQRQLRVDSYANVHRYIEELNSNRAATDRIGKAFILPASYVGSPRYMSKLFRKSMAIVRACGKPTFFITFTCNPQWPEIRENLEGLEKPFERVDLCNRVFNMKLKSLREDLLKKGIFGKARAMIYSVEFQKRGLPHAHILLIMNDPVVRTGSDIDAFVSAEIPDPEQEPELYDTVTKCLLHGPCAGRRCCNAQGECSKGYPKAFQEVSILTDDSYHTYRRRNNGTQVTQRVKKESTRIQ